MSVLYKSTTGLAVTAGNYVVTVDPGLQLENAVDILDKLVGISLERTNTDALSLTSASAEIVGVVPVIIPNSATVDAEGVITLTALPTIYSNGAWVYLQADAIVDGLAGLYWTVFSSTTVGSVKTNYVDPEAGEFVPYIPTGDLEAAVGSAAAFTTPTGVDIDLIHVALPASKITVGSKLKVSSRVTCPSAADDKIVKHLLGTTSMGQQLFTTSTGGVLTTSLFSRASNKQVLGVDIGSGVSETTFGAVNTAVASKIVIAGQLEATTGYLVVEAFTISQVIN